MSDIKTRLAAERVNINGGNICGARLLQMMISNSSKSIRS